MLQMMIDALIKRLPHWRFKQGRRTVRSPLSQKMSL